MNFFEQVLEILKADERFFAADGTLLRNAVYEAAMQMDEGLLGLLFENEATKRRFFTQVNGIYVFDKIGFGWVINNRAFLPDSYTRYQNKIGLASGGNYLSASNEVELVFPYKDCVLEGGQSKESQKRQEIFYNTALAPDEVDRLLEPKVFSGAVRVKSDGSEEIASYFTEEDNLLIKGNNLLALASLCGRYEKKIKLIYIDVPYNTGSDSFGYNDAFNHSTWLTFIQNRLSLAKRLLREDGCIFIQCDDNEQAYLKVLCDEIFGRENFVNCIAVKMSEATGVKMSHAGIRFPKIKEYLLFYKREGFRGFVEIDKYAASDKWDRENNIFLENFSKEDRAYIAQVEEKDPIGPDDVAAVKEILKNVRKTSLHEKMKELKIEKSNAEEWLFENAYRIVKTCGSESLLALVAKSGVEHDRDISCALSKENVLFFYITDYNENTAQPRLRVIFADENIYKNPCDFWQDIKTTGAIANEGGVQLLNGKKPEKLLHRIIKMTTERGDYVLDFFGGSGTTAAVAHKMGRHYIICEQLEEQTELIKKRLKAVIKGEQTGVSKETDWKGGGSFVSCELKKLNQNYAERIRDAAEEDFSSIWEEMKQTGFISSKVNPEDIDPKAADFRALSPEDKKRLLMELLDLNQLYLNKCDLEDETFCVSEADKAFTESFYGDK